MPPRHVVVDGSNIATEGRSLPSLKQLDQAVREFIAENPNDRVTVVVDATFAHRIDPSELPIFEEAEAAGEVVSPPAGAVGRGDAFLLRVAEKTGATVLSNDSFQEFHAEHPWLFESDRLVGGKPVPGVGWVFVTRTPVRGPKSREVVKQARKKKAAPLLAAAPKQTGLEMAASKAKDKKVDRAIASATQEVVSAVPGVRRRRRRSGEPPSDPVNEPLAFITFIAAHPLGSEVPGIVEEFSSHGAFVAADGARCYVPLSALGDPPPRRAREALSKGEERLFVIQALDPPRRGIELALPEFARVAGGPTAETVEEEIHPTLADESEESRAARPRTGGGRPRKDPAKAGGPAKKAPARAAVSGAEPAPERRPSGRAPVGAPAAGPRAGAGPRPSKEMGPPETAPPKKAGAMKAGAKKAEPKKAEPKKAEPRKAGAKKAVPKEAVPKKAAPKKDAAKRAPAKAAAKTAAPTSEPVKQAPPRKAMVAKTAGKAPAKQAPGKEAPAKAAGAAKTPAKKAAAANASGDAVPAKGPVPMKRSPARGAPLSEATAAPSSDKAPARRSNRTARSDR